MNKNWVLSVVFSCIGFAFMAGLYMKSFQITWQFSLLAVYIIVYFWLLARQGKNLRWSITKTVFSVLLAIFWLFSSLDKQLGSVLGWVAAVVSVVTIAFSFYLGWTELETSFQKSQPQSRSRWWIGIYAIPPFVVWFIYFLAYYPAKMTYDSFWQWDQAHRIRLYDNWHPILHTWLIQATAGIYNSPATYVILQIVTVSLIVGYALYTLRKFGAPAWILVFLDLVYALDPVNGFYAVTMWKDIPFAAVILLLTALLVQIVQSRGEWIKKPTHMIGFVIVVFFALNLRHNGPEAVFFALVLFIILIRETRIRIALLLVPIVIMQYLFAGPVTNHFHVIKNPLNQALAVPSQQIAATYTNQGHFTPKLKSYFDSILPAKNWIKDYNPYTVNPIKHDEAYNAAPIKRSFSGYLGNWAHLLALNPATFVSAYLKQVAVIWQFHSVPGLRPYFDTSLKLQQYPLGLRLMAPTSVYKEPLDKMIKAAYSSYVEEAHLDFPGMSVPSYQQYKKFAVRAMKPLQTQSKLSGMEVILTKVYWRLNNTFANYFIKAAIPLFLLLLSLFASIKRFKWRGIVVFTPAVGVLLTLLLAMPATDYRYSFSWILTVPFLLLYGKLLTTHDSEAVDQIE